MRPARMRTCRPPFLILTALALAVIGVVIAKDRERADAIEVGAVEWGRDLDAALAASKASGKPVFVLFQEVPG